MNQLEYQKLYDLEATYWWFVGRRIIIKNILQKYLPRTKNLSILDYGCGTGGTLPLLSEFGKVIGVDVSPTAVKLSQKNSHYKVDLVDLNQPLPMQDSFDLITILDVLEHIQDDQGILKNLKAHLRPGGTLLITVPAYQFLWSEHDVALKHFRRYTAHTLLEKLKLAGFEPIYCTYANFFVFPLVFVYRLLKGTINKLHPKKQAETSYVILPRWLNNFLIFLLKIESFLIVRMRLPFGSSIFLVAKPGKEMIKR